MPRLPVPQQVAAELRQQILRGELSDGATLPRYDDLLARFQVSMPSLREAVKILETEGLLVVSRGIGGGAEVRSPKRESLAYPLGLVLETQRVQLLDVAAALNQIEPLCAGLCARRHDRASSVVPQLREVHEEAVRRVESDDFTKFAREFHQAIVNCCGNETFKALVGALVTLWSAHENEWAHGGGPGLPSVAERMAGLKAHRRLIDLIEDGRAGDSVRVARTHVEESQTAALRRTARQTVDAETIQRAIRERELQRSATTDGMS